ncbi:hypothetical protein CHS0354_040863 [Potamilus streckersoni]|uniref:Uncharacterized protein n=1 Tax=Potamilus streckersoni TaxID=2493646 RepID=A0AAE0SLD5_9BIVA|nr:hypothetical protein CHS0354_040863 [Potamilus streckersoni]
MKAENRSECFVAYAANFTPDSVQGTGKSLENIQSNAVSCNSCENESVERVTSPDIQIFETHEPHSSHRYSPYASVFRSIPFSMQDSPLSPTSLNFDKLITLFTDMEERRQKYEVDLQQKRLEREERMMRHLAAMEDKRRMDENKLRLEMAEIFDKRRREINDVRIQHEAMEDRRMKEENEVRVHMMQMHVQMFQKLCSVLASSPSVHHSNFANIFSSSVRPPNGHQSGYLM